MSRQAGARNAGDFAIELAQEFSRRCPPELAQRSTMAVARAIDEVCNRAAEFQRSRRLGWYGKARFGTEFKTCLKEGGYVQEFIDELTTRLLISMSGK
jgi:hypothetical protein